jgi:hypothetical protein
MGTAGTATGWLAADGACLLLAVNGRESLGYVLGFRHLTFYANGPVGWVEEIVVRGHDRGQGHEESATYFRKVAVNQARP